MADNSTLNPGVGGDTVATDDIGGSHYQLIKLAYGALNTGTLVEAGVGLPVAPDSGGFPVQATLQTSSNAIGKIAAGVAEIGLVKNSGTFLIQENGGVLTAVQVLDNVVYVDNAAWSDGTSSHTLTGGLYQSSPQTVTDGRVAPFNITVNGALHTAVQNTVTVAAHNVTNAGTFATQATLQAGTAAFGKLAANSGVDIGDVNITASAAGGAKLFTSVDLDQTEEDVTTGATTIYSIYAWNLTAAPLWLQLFNTNSVTVGSTTPTNNYMIPANADSDGAGVQITLPAMGIAYGTALTVAITTGSGTNSGAPGAGDAGVAICYKD